TGNDGCSLCAYRGDREARHCCDGHILGDVPTMPPRRTETGAARSLRTPLGGNKPHPPARGHRATEHDVSRATTDRRMRRRLVPTDQTEQMPPRDDGGEVKG